MVCIDCLSKRIRLIFIIIEILISTSNVTEVALTPLIAELTAALDIATASLALISPLLPNIPLLPLEARADDPVATLLAGIITNIAKTLNGLLGNAAAVPGIYIPS